MAEDYHQKYRLRGENTLFKDLKKRFPQDSNFTRSTAAARINGYLAGYGSKSQLEKELPVLGLGDPSQQLLRSRHGTFHYR